MNLLKIILFFVLSVTLCAQTTIYNTLGTWSSNGVPNYLEPNNDVITADLLSRITASLPESQNILSHHPEYISSNVQSNVLLTEACDVWVTFITEGAGYLNTLGFYTYQNGNPPTSINDIQNSMTIIFPNSSLGGSGGGLNPGNKIKIGTFSANTVIGWFIVANGFRNGNIGSGNWLLFSDENLNPENDITIRQHNVLLRDPVTGKLILGFEDIRRDNGGCDKDFNDVLFSVYSNPIEAISVVDVPVLENPNQSNLTDLELQKSIDNSIPNNGENVTFTVTLKNNGPSLATSIKVADVLPLGLDFLSYSTSKGSFNQSNGEWSVNSLLVDEVATLTITCKVNRYAFSYNLGIASDYNVFALKDMNQPSCDTEGKVAVGNSAFLSNYSIGDKLDTLNGIQDVLVVGNTLDFESGAIYNGNVVYGFLTNLPIYQVSINNGSLRQDSILSFYAAETELKTLSNTLNNYTVNGEVVVSNSDLILTGTNPLLNVFTVTKEQINPTTNFIINSPNGSVVLVNVSGSGIEWKGGHVVYGTAINNVLYNFYEATNIKISNIDIQGSILAPYADLDFPTGLISGQVIAKNIIGAGQFNWDKFLGNIPLDQKIINRASISSLTQVDSNPNNNSAQVELIVGGLPNPNPPNATVQWTQLSTFPQNEMIWTMIEANGAVYVGTYGGKIYYSGGQLGEWVRINNNMNVGYIWSLEYSNGSLYAGTEQGVFVTSNNGTNWENIGLNNYDVRSLIINNNNTESSIMYAATWGFGVLKSIDGGVNWVESNNGLPNKAVQTLLFGNFGEIYAGTFGGGVAKSIDGGENWTTMNNSSAYIWKLALDNEGNLYAGTYGSGLYKSVDGESWNSSNDGINSQHIYSINFDNDNNAYVCSWSAGIFTSTNSGENWEGLGMEGMGASSLLIEPESNSIVVGTADGVVFSRPAVVVGVKDNEITNPVTFALNQNYPNPFNPSTIISYQIPNNSMVKMEVFDILGRVVKTLVNEYQNQGTYKINFNTVELGLSSGIYFYRITTDFNNSVKKMILIK
ncbi:MAG: choice-of-anchor A family protein [bacterium]